MSFRNAASFGKRQEYVAIAELLRRGFDVYMTLVDDQGIDCVVRLMVGGEPVYLDIQIKARSKDCSPRNAGTFAAMSIPDPRPNYLFLFYSEQLDSYWVIPSTDLVRKATENKAGKNKGRFSIHLTAYSKKTGKVSPRDSFSAYEDSFELLREYTGQPG